MFQPAKYYLYALAHNDKDKNARAKLQDINDRIEAFNKEVNGEKEDHKINVGWITQHLRIIEGRLKTLQASPDDKRARDDYNVERDLIKINVETRHFPTDWIPGELPEPGAGVEGFADLLKTFQPVEVPNQLSGEGASKEQSGGAGPGASTEAAPNSSGGVGPGSSNEAAPNLSNGDSTSSAVKPPMRPKPAKVSVIIPDKVATEHKVSVKIRDESDGNTSVGKVVMAKRLGPYGARVIVNRGTDELPYYEVYPGSQFLKGQARNWAEKEQFKWPAEIPLGKDAEIIGRAEVEPTSRQVRCRPIRYYVVKMKDESGQEQLYGYSKTGLGNKGRIGAAKARYIDQQLDSQLRQARMMLNECRIKEEADKMPWLSSDAPSSKQN